MGLLSCADLLKAHVSRFKGSRKRGSLKLISLVGWVCWLPMLKLLDGLGGDGYHVCRRSWLVANHSV